MYTNMNGNSYPNTWQEARSQRHSTAAITWLRDKGAEFRINKLSQGER